MGYMNDFMSYMGGTECPDSFLRWSALSLIGHLCGKKVWTMHGDYFPFSPNLYVVLVGTPGSGKSTAKDFVKDIMTDHFDSYILGDEIQSREHICKTMASPPGTKTWKNLETTTIEEWHPFYCLPDEMALFVSVDARNMINFLVGVHSSKSFGTGYKKDFDLAQRFKNPYVSLLGCTTPKWIMQNLKIDLFEGGLGRRLIIVFDKRTKDIPDPKRPDKSSGTYARIIEHLKAVEALSGQVKRTKTADLWWRENYAKIRANKGEQAIDQFKETKHTMVLKVATCLSLDERPFTMEITDEHLWAALDGLNRLEAGINMLTAGIGENPATAIAARMMEYIYVADGEMQERRLRAVFMKDCRDDRVYNEAVNHLVATEELVLIRMPIGDPNGKQFLLTPKTYEKRKREGNGK